MAHDDSVIIRRTIAASAKSIGLAENREQVATGNVRQA
jgi:hypothetical protein